MEILGKELYYTLKKSYKLEKDPSPWVRNGALLWVLTYPQIIEKKLFLTFTNIFKLKKDPSLWVELGAGSYHTHKYF